MQARAEFGTGSSLSSGTVATRVMIMGGSGSGKSFLALKLAQLSGLPSHHMDQLSWRPGFVHRSTAELDAATRDIHARDHWILEGGHYETGRERAARAHLLIWLDPHPLLQGWRVLHRSLRHHRKVRPCMAEGCPESFGLHTVDVIRYAWQSRPFHQERIREIIATAPPGLRIQRLGSGRQARRFLSRCARAAHGPGLLVPQDL